MSFGFGFVYFRGYHCCFVDVEIPFPFPGPCLPSSINIPGHHRCGFCRLLLYFVPPATLYDSFLLQNGHFYSNGTDADDLHSHTLDLPILNERRQPLLNPGIPGSLVGQP